MEYNFEVIEKKWQEYWAEHQSFKANENSDKPKYYVLDMFPYPSGAGLHDGHPLGYIASDIVARYKRLKGFNVLHPMGYDSFGLPAEQYAIQTGQHPAITTETNIARYREQLDRLGFSFDWDREIRTSDPSYFKWTQWIFIQLFNAWYSNDVKKARPIQDLIDIFELDGNVMIDATCDEDTPSFTAAEWKAFDEKQQEDILLKYRLAYLSESVVNWCPALGTVLANDEVKDGLSERGGHPVEQRSMMQWSMRITAYADRLLAGLDTIDWSDSLKEIQRNWIGKSKGASVFFHVANSDHQIEVFTTRPDTIYGVSFMVLAPDHELVEHITTADRTEAVKAYQEQTAKKSERERMADAKTISGEFTGAYVTHPFTKEQIPVWIGDYVLSGYGTGAIMAVPAGDQRDWNFANHFDLPIPTIFENHDVSEGPLEDKTGVLTNSDFMNGLKAKKAISKAIDAIYQRNTGSATTNFKLRDAVFGRQRYWGEPIPIYYENGIPKPIKDEHLPLELPEVDKYLPTEDGEPPLARADKWNYHPEKGIVANGEGFPIETTTMPGWAGSSWYYLRYQDAKNTEAFVDADKTNYWEAVDLYMGGAEHATGHLLYVRFWTKFLHDMELIPVDEPAKKLINQGMIQGQSKLVYRVNGTNEFVTASKKADYDTTAIHVDVNFVNGDSMDIERFKNWGSEYSYATFILEDDGSYQCGTEVEKMSKRWFNVVNPDDICASHGADALRLHEMFLGPIELHKPWNTKGIDGVSKFLRKLWRLFFNEAGEFEVSDAEPTKAEYKALHKCIQKVEDEFDRFVFNTSVSHFMICVNELTELNCNKRDILEQLTVLVSCHAPHISEELWNRLGNDKSVTTATFPEFKSAYLVENEHTYPVSFNGKVRFKLTLPADASKEDVESAVMSNEQATKWLDGKQPKKVIVVPKRIVNIVL
jgi:leucyl-tRNA synthetase